MNTLALPFPFGRRGSDGASLVTAILTGWSRPVAETLPAAPEVGPYWRGLYTTPPDLRLETGGWCRFCDGQLNLTTTGWYCDAPSCRAAWDFQGRHGWWLPGGAR